MLVLADHLGLAGDRAGIGRQPQRHRLLGVHQVHQHGAVERGATGDPGSIRPGPHRGHDRVLGDPLHPVRRRGPVGDVERAVGRIDAHAATGTHPGQRGGLRCLIDGGGLLDAQHLSRQRRGIAGLRRVAGVTGLDHQRRRAGEDQRAGIAGGALRDPGEDRLGRIAVGDAHHTVVGGSADVGVHQPVLGIGRRFDDVEQTTVTGRVHRDDQLDLRLGLRRHLFDHTGGALGDQRRLAVAAHDQTAGARQATLHDAGGLALLRERRGGQRWGRFRFGRRRRRHRGLGGERLGLGVVEPCASRTDQQRRAQQHRQSQRHASGRCAQSHAGQITDPRAVRATKACVPPRRCARPGVPPRRCARPGPCHNSATVWIRCTMRRANTLFCGDLHLRWHS